jgi:hypothetical protein
MKALILAAIIFSGAYRVVETRGFLPASQHFGARP